jgi:hypothetical protein
MNTDEHRSGQKQEAEEAAGVAVFSFASFVLSVFICVHLWLISEHGGEGL